MACASCSININDNDFFIKCHACDRRFHPHPCCDIPGNTARSFNDSTSRLPLFFLCRDCRISVPSSRTELDAMRGEIDELRSLLNSSPATVPSSVNQANSPSHADVSARLDALEGKIDDLIRSFNQDDFIASVTSAISQATFDAIAEANEVNSKRLNVVAFGITPSSQKTDLELIRDIVSPHGISPDGIVEVWRAGPPPRRPNHSRLLKIRLSTTAIKHQILDAARRRKFGGVFIRKDLTWKQRMARKEAAQNRQNNDSVTVNVNPSYASSAIVSPTFLSNNVNSNQRNRNF